MNRNHLAFNIEVLELVLEEHGVLAEKFFIDFRACFAAGVEQRQRRRCISLAVDRKEFELFIRFLGLLDVCTVQDLRTFRGCRGL